MDDDWGYLHFRKAPYNPTHLPSGGTKKAWGFLYLSPGRSSVARIEQCMQRSLAEPGEDGVSCSGEGGDGYGTGYPIG